MKKTLLILSLFALFAACKANHKVVNLEFLITNDLHGAYFDSLYTEDSVHSFSMSKIYGYAERQRAELGKDNIVMIDVGDNLQGDLCTNYANYVDTVASAPKQKHLITRIFEYVGYDAIVVGNHDIETGHTIYDRIKNEISIPYLAANAIDEKTGKCYFLPYCILNKNGVKVAIIGLTNHYITNWIDSSLYRGIKFYSICSIADSLVNAIRNKENPDLTIMAIHSGMGTVDDNHGENVAMALASKIKNVDILLAAHDHKTFSKTVYNGNDSLLVIESGTNGAHIAKIDVSLQFKHKKVIKKIIRNELVSMINQPSNDIYNKYFYPDFLKVKAYANLPVGYLSSDLNTIDALFGYSDYINTINSIQMTYAKSDISFTAPLKAGPIIKKGVIKISDMIDLYPFENYLYKIELTGQQIKDYLEYTYSKWVNTLENPGDHILRIKYDKHSGSYVFITRIFNYDAAKGIKYTVDITKKQGNRISIISMEDGTPFNISKKYSVALTSYRASGGGELLQNGAKVNPSDIVVIEHLPNIRDLIQKYIQTGHTLPITDTPNWKFIPENLAKVSFKRDSALISRRISDR